MRQYLHPLTGGIKWDFLLPILVFLCVYGAWGGMLSGGLVSDDWVWLESAKDGSILIPGKFFRPGCWLTWRFQVSASPGAIHCFDLLLHWFCSWQVGILAWRLSGRPAAGIAGGAVFAVLPTLHEAVCWSSARCGPLAAGVVLAGINAAMAGWSATITVLLLIFGLSVKEPALALMWGLPLLLVYCRQRSRKVLNWALVLLTLTAIYALVLRSVGAHSRLSGGYAAPFDTGRTLSHLGAYLGLGVGFGHRGDLWPLWGLAGAIALIAGFKGKRLGIVLWIWMSMVLLPFIKLGGPEQERFLYMLSICPVVGGAILFARTIEYRRWWRIAGVVLLIGGTSWMAAEARGVTRDWVGAGGRARVVIANTAGIAETDSPHILVNPPEWNGRAHLFRNGLFQALRWTTWRPVYQGITIPPSWFIDTAGDLVTWLSANANEFLQDQQIGAWSYDGETPKRLKGWRVPENAGSLLTELVVE